MYRCEKAFLSLNRMQLLLLFFLVLHSSVTWNGRGRVYCSELFSNRLYEPDSSEYYSIETLPEGDSEFVKWPLERPIHFYSDMYSMLYINTNGLLTFNTEFPEYINQPFPLEYPAVAPFYANVDTSYSSPNNETSISVFTSQDPEHLLYASNLVKYAFEDREDYEAGELIVATWKNVGYYQGHNDLLNTFQAVLIVNDEETYVQLIYPSGGLNWLQGENGPLGLPDIRAQAGFIAEDGRFFDLDGSGTSAVRFLDEKSNINVPGVWLYRVGPLDYESEIQLPSNSHMHHKLFPVADSCSGSGQHVCSVNAYCIDKPFEEIMNEDNSAIRDYDGPQSSLGFCCLCQPGFYGNGKVCIKDNIPARITGSLTGELNGYTINERSKLQSYIVTADGRSYTAITPISDELGGNLRLAFPIINSVGWLFAKPLRGHLNGYQLTRGEFLHTSRIRFDSGEILYINQTFEGLNYWDQLSVRVNLQGHVPYVHHAHRLHMSEYFEEYQFITPNQLESKQSHVIEVREESRLIRFHIEQKIYFENCWRKLDELNDFSMKYPSYVQKVAKINIDYFEQDRALRTSMLTSVGAVPTTNACTDNGASLCGENMICIPYEDSYQCDCMYGYTPYAVYSDIQNNEGFDTETETVVHSCIDIDECALGSHSCHDFATCINREGGYSCTCLPGYQGNGYSCYVNNTVADNMESSVNPITQRAYPEKQDYYNQPAEGQESELNPSERHDLVESTTRGFAYDVSQDNCQYCSPYADCWEGRCVCKATLVGDGVNCECAQDEIWDEDRCIHVMEPNCYWGQCMCETGYEFTEDARFCRYVGQSVESEANKDDELVPCDVEFNCHPNATCDWDAINLRHKCTCSAGFYGDGYNCEHLDDSCATNAGLCHAQATCVYDESNDRYECLCLRGFQGNGYHCESAPECLDNIDCGQFAYCDKDMCRCLDGYERDVTDDVCVPIGSCGSVTCAANAVCRYDAREAVKYCECIQGYEGDALVACKSKPIPCNVQYNCGAHATCEPTEDPAHYKCECVAGYLGDGYVCVEDQNCLNTPQLCDMNAQCLSTNSGLVCVCNKGFYGNGSLCLERQQHDTGFLVVSQGVVIVRVPLNGKNVRPISVASMAIGLDKDCVEGRVYWGDISAKKIISSRYDGSDQRAFLNEDIHSPEGIAIDSVSRRIYWTDSIKDTIEVASLEEPSLRAIVIAKNLVNPRGIAVDPYREKLFWSDWNRDSPKIEMSDLDGTGREVLLGKDQVLLPNSLVMLDQTGELCYADAGTKRVECVDLYTKKTRIISNELTYPFGLVFTHNQFFWTDWVTKKLESVDSFGQRQKSLQVPFFGSHKMYAMTAIEDNCPQIDSPCLIKNGGCTDSRLCLVNRKSPSGKSCKCTAISQLCPQSLSPSY